MSGGTATKTSFTRGEDPLRADKLNTALSERVSRAGDKMDGYLALVGDPVAPFDAATKQYVDRWLGLIGPSGTAPAAFVGAAPPGNVPAPLWWDSNGGQLYVQYDDGSSVQWVLANAITGGPYLRLSGDTVTGPIVAITGLTIGSAAGPQWITGNGTPSGVVTAPRGSMFSRGDGAVGTTLYVSQGGTTWNPVAGV